MLSKIPRSGLLLCLSILIPLVFGATPSRAMPPIQRTVLPNQLVVLLTEEHSLPFVTFQLLVDGGAREDPSGKEGLAHLTAQGLLWGTAKRSARAINEELDYMGASLQSSCGPDYSVLSLKILKKDLDRGLDLFRDVLGDPQFSKEEMEKEITKNLATIQAAEDDPGDVAEKAFQRALFDASPYGHPVIGTKESLGRIQPQDLSAYYRKYYYPDHSILAVAGDITWNELKSSLLAPLEKWPRANAAEPPYQGHFAKGPKTIKMQRSVSQANIIIGHEGVARGNPDFYTLAVMNFILGGGGFSSRLMEEIRNARGLAYSVGSFFAPAKYAGSFQIVLQTKNASAREAISLALRQMEKIRSEPVSEKELDGARKYLIGSFPMRVDSQGKLVNFLSQVEYFKLGLDYAQKYPEWIRAVTREDIRRAARTYLHPERCLQVVVADLKEAGME
jgi:zinc protease